MIDRRWIPSLALAAVAVASTTAAGQSAKKAAVKTSAPNYVEIVKHEPDRRVDVLVGGKAFTSYIWPSTLKKPVLFPLVSAAGTTVTRGYPLEPREGERVDHPHHAGMWFNYGDVNGLDFWNNSDAIRPAQAPKMGTIVHQSIRSAKSGVGEGTLEVTSQWVTSENKPLLREDTRFVFRAKDGVRSIDRITKLTALDSTVVLGDNKEGLIGIRLARQLEHPSLTPEKFTDASGRVTDVAKLDTAGVHGHYISFDGKEGDDVWGTRSKWTMLTGDVNGAPVTLAMLDHPKNRGFPTYWHARGYGLFAANPLGQKAMTNGKGEATTYKLDPKASITFRHEVLILDGKAVPADVEKYYTAFSR
ncbi:MAG: PmoA family protein [Gemmatimonadaceae bacterium]